MNIINKSKILSERRCKKQMKQINGTMLQYFEWYLNEPQGLWNKVKSEAEDLSNLGITSVWLPPAYKGINGKNGLLSQFSSSRTFGKLK